MTADEMGYRLLVGYDRLASADADGLTAKERSLLLTEAYESIVLQKINPKGNKYREGFDETEIRKKNLAELISYSELSDSDSQTGVHDNGKFYDLPSDFWLAISEEADVTYTGIDGNTASQTVGITPITYDEYNANIKNPYKKPFVNASGGFLWRLDFSKQDSDSKKRVEIIAPEDCTITAYKARYLKKLSPIVLTGVTFEGVTGPNDCILNKSIHSEIVKVAIKSATANIRDVQGYQIQSVEANNAE